MSHFEADGQVFWNEVNKGFTACYYLLVAQKFDLSPQTSFVKVLKVLVRATSLDICQDCGRPGYHNLPSFLFIGIALSCEATLPSSEVGLLLCEASVNI